MNLALLYSALEWKTEDDNRGYDIGEFPHEKVTKKNGTVVLNTKATPKKTYNSSPENKDENIEMNSCAFESDEETLGCLYPIEEPPIFPGCENETDIKACFTKMMSKHITTSFNFQTTENLNVQGRAYIQFVIEKDGSIGEITTRGPHKSLEVEAKRVISELPKMIPAKYSGSPIKVPYSIPIILN